MDEKIHFVFNMYDVSHDNTVSKQDLTTLLNQIPKAHLGNSSDHGGDYYHHGQQQAPYSPAPSDFTLTRQRSLSGSSTSMSEQEEPTGVAGAAPHMLHAHSREQSREIKPDAASATPASAGAAAGGGQFGNAPGIGERDASSAAPAGAHPLGITREGSTSAVNTAGLPGTITDFDYEDVDFYTNHDMVQYSFKPLKHLCAHYWH